MKKILSTLLALTLIGTVATAEKMQLQAKEPTASEGEYLYEVQEDEVLVNDKLITLFVIGKDSISVSYRNKTEKKTKPKYTLRAYNPYGLLIAEEVVGDAILFGSNTYMEPGEVSAEKINLDRYPLEEIFKNSNLHLAEDLMKIQWLVLAKTNTK